MKPPGKIIRNPRGTPKYRLLIGVPMTGLLRAEWVMARYGQIIPTNWSASDYAQWVDQYSPIQFMVADARNILVHQAITQNYEWLFFIDHDVVLPPDTLLRLNAYIREDKVPIVSGLYFTRSVPAEPLIYRGRGNSYFTGWKLGDKVWVDGCGMGCCLINVKVLKALADESETYQAGPHRVKKVFESPAKSFYDPERMGWVGQTGTEDLHFLGRVIDQDILTKAGYPKIAKKKYPILVDTSIYCAHIDWDGVQYPSRGEDQEYIRKADKDKLGLV